MLSLKALFVSPLMTSGSSIRVRPLFHPDSDLGPKLTYEQRPAPPSLFPPKSRMSPFSARPFSGRHRSVALGRHMFGAEPLSLPTFWFSVGLAPAGTQLGSYMPDQDIACHRSASRRRSDDFRRSERVMAPPGQAGQARAVAETCSTCMCVANQSFSPPAQGRPMRCG